MRVATVFACLLIVMAARGYADDVSDLKKEIEELKKRVEEMEERGKAKAEPPWARFGANLGLFGDVNYSTHSRERENKTFYAGALGLYSTASVDERLNFLFEAIIVSHNDRSSIDMERIWAGYT
jgi:hypothetical protein